jgi:hypothetical protein
MAARANNFLPVFGLETAFLPKKRGVKKSVNII